MGKQLSTDAISAAIERAPGVGAVLRKLADKVARGVALPARFSVGELGYEAQRELEGLLGIVGKRMPDGRVSFPLPDELREPSAWREATAFFGLAKEDAADGEDIFARLKLLLPEAAWILDRLAERDEVSRFVAGRENGRDWMRLFRHVMERRLLCGASGTITLSQLGSDCFNDSKKLRTGALRRQLVNMLSILSGHDPNDERSVFGHFGIVDNPYTTSVTAFIPMAFITNSGVQFEFPRRLYEEGMACQLPLETIQNIAGVGWARSVSMTVTTCENAAPFARMVEKRIPCIYTEGYPNYCVKRLLTGLRIAGVKCVHEGDADLDGFRIAGEVAKSIPVERVVAADALSLAVERNLPVGIPLTDAQRERAEAFLAGTPDFAYAGDIRKMLDWGRWIEQESFESLFGRKGAVR